MLNRYKVRCDKYKHAAQIAAICHTCYTCMEAQGPAWPSLLLLDALHEVIVPLQEVLMRTLFPHGPPRRGDESGFGSNESNESNAQVGKACEDMLKVFHRCSMQFGENRLKVQAPSSHVA